MSTDILIDVQGLYKKYSLTFRHMLKYGVRDMLGELDWRNDGRRPPTLRPGEFWALQDVSFQLRRGEALGMIGANGAGKSTLLRLIGGLIKPDGGRLTVRGRVGLLNELGTGMNPSLTGRENIYLSASLMGLKRWQTDRVLESIIDFAGIEEAFIDAPMQTYSSGMWVRLGYAVAAHLQPDVLLVDEVLAVGDLTFQQKCVQHMHRYLAGGGALVFVSHNSYQVQTVCHNVLLLEHGQVKFQGTVNEGLSLYFREQQEQKMVNEPVAGVTAPAWPQRDGPLIVEDVTIQPLAGDELCSGEAARITTHYRAKEAMAGVNYGFGIMTGDRLVNIIGVLCPKLWPITQGKGEITCTIPRLPLTAGIFALRVTLMDAQTLVPIFIYGYECPPTIFRVRAAASLEANLQAHDGAIVTVDVVWDLPGS